MPAVFRGSWGLWEAERSGDGAAWVFRADVASGIGDKVLTAGFLS